LQIASSPAFCVISAYAKLFNARQQDVAVDVSHVEFRASQYADKLVPIGCEQPNYPTTPLTTIAAVAARRLTMLIL